MAGAVLGKQPRSTALGYALLAPSLFGVVAFLLLPILVVVWLSLYRWDLEMAAMTTVRPPSKGNGWTFPYQDYYAALRLPHLLGDELSLEAIASYSNEETLKYYGLGDASKVEPITDQTNPLL